VVFVAVVEAEFKLLQVQQEGAFWYPTEPNQASFA